MAIAYVKDGGKNAFKTAQSTLAITVPAGGHAQGNCVIVIVGHESTTATWPPSLSDTRGNTWTTLNSGTTANTSGERCAIFASILTTALQAGDTITATWSPNTPAKANMEAQEFSGVDAALTQDSTAGQAQANAATSSTASTTPATSGSLVIGGIQGGASNFDPPSGPDTDTTNGSWSTAFTTGSTGGATGSRSSIASQYKIVSASGAQTWNLTFTSSAYCETLVSLKAAAGAPVAVPLQTAAITFAGLNARFNQYVPLQQSAVTFAGLNASFNQWVPLQQAAVTFAGLNASFNQWVPLQQAPVTFAGNALGIVTPGPVDVPLQQAAVTFAGLNVHVNQWVPLAQAAVTFAGNNLTVFTGVRVPLQQAAVTFAGANLAITTPWFVPLQRAAITITPAALGITAPISVPVQPWRVRRRLPSRHAATIIVPAATAGFAPSGQSSTKQAGTAADDSSAGSVAWSNPSNALANDGVGASASLGSVGAASGSVSRYAGTGANYPVSGNQWGVPAWAQGAPDSIYTQASMPGGAVSDALGVTNYGAGVPSDATITGVQFVVRRRTDSNGAITITSARLFYGGVVIGTGKSPGDSWQTAVANTTMGNSGDLWGTSLTPAMVNDSSFGLYFNVVNNGGLSHWGQVDSVQMIVYYTTPTYSSQASHNLKLTNYGYSIPSTATITGIGAEVIRKDGLGGGVQDALVQLVKAGSAVGTNKAAGGNWPTSGYVSKVYGGAGDLWGTTWAYSEVNASNFGVLLRATGGGTGPTDGLASVDAVLITVYYTLPGSEVAIAGAPPIRFSPEEPLAERVLLDSDYDTELPGGFGPATLVIPHPEFFDPSDYLYGQTTLYEYETGQVLHKGRCVGVSDDGSQVGLELEGWINLTGDDHTVRFLGIDRDYGNWQGMSVARKIGQAGNPTQMYDAEVVPDPVSGAASLSTQYDSADYANKIPLIEGWYDAKGMVIGVLDGIWKQINSNAGQWSWQLDASTDDVGTTVNSSGGILAAGPGTVTVNTTGGNKKFARVLMQWFNTASSPGTAALYAVYWTLLAVVGNHGLTLRGSLSQPNTGRGLYVSDIIAYLMANYVANLPVETIEATTTALTDVKFGIDEPTTVREMIEGLVIFGGNTAYPLDFGAYENGLFVASPGSYGNTWRTRYDEGAEADNQGLDVQRMLNGVLLRYDPYGDGTTQTVGPPGSGADFTNSSLVDSTDSNPSNRDGQRHWEVYDAGIMPNSVAVLVGTVILAERNRQTWRGDVTVKDMVRDAANNWCPVGYMHSGDYLIVEDDLDTRPRRIVNTKASASSRQVACSIGAQPDKLDVFLARSGVRFVGVLT